MSRPADEQVLLGHGGSRIPWERLPDRVRTGIEDAVDGRITASDTQPGGFSPSVAARVVLADGRRMFVKAAGSEPNPKAPEFHRAEARIAGALPIGVPAPQLLATYDDGDWVALVFEDIEGTAPALPWREAELARVLTAVGELADGLTPAPVAAPAAPEVLRSLFGGWRELAETGGIVQIDGWAERHLEWLTELEQGAELGAEGTTLLHLDLRADNFLLTPDRVVVIDWPHASVGAPWLDLLLLLPSIGLQGGPSPWEIFDRHRLARTADPEQVTRLIGGLAGFFLARGLRPPPPGVPNVRDFQTAQGFQALDWLKHRLGPSRP